MPIFKFEMRCTAVQAKVAASEERQELWTLFIRLFPGYQAYQTMTDRVIPVVIQNLIETNRTASYRTLEQMSEG